MYVHAVWNYFDLLASYEKVLEKKGGDIWEGINLIIYGEFYFTFIWQYQDPNQKFFSYIGWVSTKSMRLKIYYLEQLKKYQIFFYF